MDNSITYTPEQLDILFLDVPEPEPAEDGFLDITDQLFKETVISKTYAYFLSQERNSEVAGIFLDSLLELIEEKSISKKELNLQDFSVVTEESTKSGKRIDIVLKDKEGKSCIIIENKIFHWLHNDLDDYWRHYDFQPINKAGIVLSIAKQKHLHKNFINITHGEWMARIKSNGLPPGLGIREYVYVGDFIKHMENLSQTSVMNDDAKFYFQNADKINRARDVFDHAFKYLQDQLKITAEKLGWQFWGWSEGYYRHIQPIGKAKLAYYAITYDEFFMSQPKIRVIIELGGKAIEHVTEINQAISDKKELANLAPGNNSGNGWFHLLTKNYVLQPNEIENLSDFLTTRIEADFKPLMDGVWSYLGSKKLI